MFEQVAAEPDQLVFPGVYRTQGGSFAGSPHESFKLDLLGFDGEVPMLTTGPEQALGGGDSVFDCGGSPVPSPSQDSSCVKVELLQDESVSAPTKAPSRSPSPTVAIDSLIKEETVVSVTSVAECTSTTITTTSVSSVECSEPQSEAPLQGKRVIIRTNSMSGEKSLIFNKRTGENVEIRAKLSTLGANGSSAKGGPKMVIKEEEVDENDLAVVVFPPKGEAPEPARHTPTILKRQGRLKYNVFTRKDTSYCSLMKDPGKAAGEKVASNVVPTNVLQRDHNYVNLAASAAVAIDDTQIDFDWAIPISDIRLSSLQPNKPLGRDVNGFSEEESSEEEQTDPLQLPNPTKPQSNEKHDRPIKTYVRQPPPSKNYEICTPPQPKPDPLGETQTDSTKPQFLVMIANKDMIEKSQKKKKSEEEAHRPLNHHPVAPKFRIPFRKQLKLDQYVQTNPSRLTQSVETNTDSSLLEAIIEKRVQERLQHNKVSKATNTDFPPFTNPPNLMTQPQPTSMLSDPFDLVSLDLCDFFDDDNLLKNTIPGLMGDPVVGYPATGVQNYSHFPPLGTNIMDISYSTGKNVYNGVSHPPNTSVYNLIGPNGKVGTDSWKIKLFLDLKRCDQFDSSGNLPLHAAVMGNNLSQVRRQCLALRTRRIDINTMNHDSLSALQLSILHEASVHIVHILLQYGGDTSIIDSEGNNLLHACVNYSSEAVLQLLLNAKLDIDINATNFDGDTPLIMCAQHKKYVKADSLLSRGADANIGDKKSGRTPLFHAVEANDVEMVKLLLNNKAQAKVRNFFGTSPHDAMFELDSVDPIIRKLVLHKDETAVSSKPIVKRRRKRATAADELYSIRPKSYRLTTSRTSMAPGSPRVAPKHY